jgi:hypothetical protein
VTPFDPEDAVEAHTSTLDLGADLLLAIRERAPGAQWIDAVGTVAEPAIDVATSTGERATKALGGVWDLVSLRGLLGPGEPAELYALVSREGPLGQELVGGVLRSARVVRVALRASLANVSRDASPRAVDAPVTPVDAFRATLPTASPSNRGASPSQPGTMPTPPGGAPLPRRPPRPDDGPESYPEEGDTVDHFAFGRCTVVFSDGERIRLQQERDGRIREVALSMLRIGAPVLDAGRRHWVLARKN